MNVETGAKTLQISEETSQASCVGWSCIRMYEDYPCLVLTL